MATRIDSVSSRQRLKPRQGPCCHRLSAGCYLGYRKMSSAGHGSWLARMPDNSTGKQYLYKALGEFSELPDHLRFDAAQKAARAVVRSRRSRWRRRHYDRHRRLRHVRAALASHKV